MKIRKRTIPTVPGGLMNRAFIYVPAANTDISLTFAKARAAQSTGNRRLTPLLGGARP